MSGELTRQVVLFSLILMRMSGFILLNPVLGRRGIPGMAKAGMIMALSVMIYPTAVLEGGEPASTLALLVLLLKEFAFGYLIGFTMQLFDYAVTCAGAVLDFQMGLSMATVYDVQNGAQTALSGSIMNLYYMLLFFAVNGHLALMKILTASGRVVPYGRIVFGTSCWNAMLEIFIRCTELAVKMAFPLIAIEFLTEVGVGILMKIIPQINLFVLNIQLKVLIGLLVLLFLISPIGDYFSGMITEMMNTIQEVVRLAAG